MYSTVQTSAMALTISRLMTYNQSAYFDHFHLAPKGTTLQALYRKHLAAGSPDRLFHHPVGALDHLTRNSHYVFYAVKEEVDYFTRYKRSIFPIFKHGFLFNRVPSIVRVIIRCFYTEVHRNSEILSGKKKTRVRLHVSSSAPVHGPKTLPGTTARFSSLGCRIGSTRSPWPCPRGRPTSSSCATTPSRSEKMEGCPHTYTTVVAR